MSPKSNGKKRHVAPTKRERAKFGYRFIEKDPIVDVYREAKRISGMKDAEIAEKSGVTVKTLASWDFGDTKKPQRLTMRFALKATGFEEFYRNSKGVELTPEYLHRGKKI